MQQAVGTEIVGVGVASAFATEHADAAAGAGALRGRFDDPLVDSERCGRERFEVEIGVVAASRKGFAQAALEQALGESEFVKKITSVTGTLTGTRGGGRIGHCMFSLRRNLGWRVSAGPRSSFGAGGVWYSSARAPVMLNSSHEEDSRCRLAPDGVRNPGVRFLGTPPSPSPPPSSSLLERIWSRSSSIAGTRLLCRDSFRQKGLARQVSY